MTTRHTVAYMTAMVVGLCGPLACATRPASEDFDGLGTVDAHSKRRISAAARPADPAPSRPVRAREWVIDGSISRVPAGDDPDEPDLDEPALDEPALDEPAGDEPDPEPESELEPVDGGE